SAIQAKARAARYALLGRWCRDAGVLHLLLAHQMDDQAETVLMRLQAGSGPDGLAGMSAIVETPDVRLLRPLLDVRRIALRACLSGLGQPWIEDPSNDNPKFLRTRLRRAAAALATAGVTTQSLAGTARRFADVRMALDAAAAELTARAVGLNPLGFAWAAPGVFLQAPAEIAVRALARVLAAVGGRIHPSAADKVRGILAAGRGENTGSGGVATLAGCVIERRGDLWLVRREVRGLPVPEPVTAGWRDSWDGRFAISVRDAPDESEGLLLAPLGENGWREILDHAPVFRTLSVYRGVRATLPAFYDRCGVAGVPSLGYVRPSANPRMAAWLMAARADFRPRRVVAGPGFFVAPIASAGDDAK
ncbi:MAG: tRNA lysidine(34) synthetase TilS, partial [Alphaproteobacteria bacterium]|nr:tRNA lysidine(34) synthetase TilS [Alphaproteobacteria bacterium]